MKSTYLFGFLAICLFWGCGGNQSNNNPEVTITNPIAQARTDAFVVLEASKLRMAHPDLDLNKMALFQEDVPLAFQAKDLDTDGTIDEIVFVADLAPNA